MSFIYGLDLSLACTGITIFDTEKQDFVYIGSINTERIKKKKGFYLNATKLKFIYDELTAIKEQYPPHIVIIERGFSRFNTATQVIYRVHGITNMLFHQVDQVYYPPKSVKEAILNGNATKAQLQVAINTKYNDIIFNNEDESDSFAVCLTYLIKEGLIDWVKPEIPKKRIIKKVVKAESVEQK